MLQLSITFRQLQLIDSSSYYNKKGIKQSLKDSMDIYYYFVLNEGINLYHKKQYKASLDSINKGTFFLEKYYPNSILKVSGYLYLAKLNRKFNDSKNSLKYLRILDETAKSGYVYLEMREGYKMLIDYYKSENDKDKQLYYINKLLSADSILDKQYKNLNKKIIKEFDTPNLLREKEELIVSLEAEKGVSAKTIAIISLLLVLSLGGVSYYYYNQRRYKKRFLQLVETNARQSKSKEKPPKNKTEISSINPETLEHLLSQLQLFEERQGYLSSKINSKDLAKSFGSNSSYLSLVINTYKKKSLSQYLNDLRIDFAVEKLQSDARFRKYTIKAIAQEVGFKTAEAFAKTFYKKTGIYPSYFIKKLEKQSSGTST
ncbi:helix-turn-helix domain-containing protein [Aquimarina algiphila]|uniref:Helix-turn-helix domain-containing protein n=1 Tax=Aquimarina algiphila TaxID=2047982 RepID=A0A554VNY5_9FLAO|nr:helix-turn-helix domain-containing protein [Aquimarina algiphila]TSE10096.1 helix-turn-helix domain-containing protein [Aquimarina algiphila]